MDSQDLLADRLNLEPLIFRGSSSSELVMILIVAAGFWFPVTLLIATLSGAPLMGLGTGGLCILATVYFGSTVFQRIKRDRPDFYYQHRLLTLGQDLKLLRTHLIRYSGVWDLGRTR